MKYDVQIDHNKLVHCEESYKSHVNLCSNEVTKRKIANLNSKTDILPFNYVAFTSLSDTSSKERYISSYKHEAYMFQLKHIRCCMCQAVSLYKDYTKVRGDDGKYICNDCKQKNVDFFYKKGTNGLLPVWFDDDGEVKYDLPTELQDLRLGEKLLIQRFSCFVPIVHIRNGVMGLKGHCCCFKQEISEVAKTLPRLQVNAVKVLKGIQDSRGVFTEASFVIRKEKVMNALKWLKKYHKSYREDTELEICEDNLNWMNGKEECELRDVLVIDEHDDLESVFEPHTGYVSDLNNKNNFVGYEGTFFIQNCN